MGEWFGLEVVDSDSGYSHISTKRKSRTESETCTKRKRCRRIAIYDSSESENENYSDKNEKENTDSDSDSGVNRNEVENENKSESENESSEETETFEKENSRNNETDESDSREKNDSDSSKNESSGETDSDESESSSDADSDTSNGNEADIDKLKPKSIRSGSKIFFKCPVCCFRCPSTGRIYGHMVKQHGAKKFQCEKCDFSTENKTSLLNHIRCYCKGRGLKPKCFLTKRKVPTRQVKMPKQNVVRKKVLFFCKYCDHSGKSSGIIFAHMCKEHGIEPFKCSKYKFATGNKTSFYNHITHYCKK